MKSKKAKDPFIFYTRHNLTELLGIKAANLSQLLKYIKEVPGSSIYHHTHRFLQIHLYLSPEPPNDFSYWVANMMREDELAERLSCIDIMQYSSIRELRDKIASIIEEYLKEYPKAKQRYAKEGQEFYFMKSISFALPTKYVASNLKEFVLALKEVSIHSIYFHIFESRIRLEKGDNDFSFWLRTSLGEHKLAENISRIDPYTFTLEGLRRKLISMIEEYLQNDNA
jgi:hypothetical protein